MKLKFIDENGEFYTSGSIIVKVLKGGYLHSEIDALEFSPRFGARIEYYYESSYRQLWETPNMPLKEGDYFSIKKQLTFK
jgi:hypothetical protein